MTIELDEQQAEALTELLRGALGDLSAEIAGTDNAGYRDGLRARRASLEGVLAAVDSARERMASGPEPGPGRTGVTA